MFPMAGHSVQQIWTGFGMRHPYNLRMVKRGLFLQRNRATPECRGQFSNASRRGSSSSYQPRPCNVRTAHAVVDGRACRRGPRHSTGIGIAATTAVVSQTTRDLHLQSTPFLPGSCMQQETTLILVYENENENGQKRN